MRSLSLNELANVSGAAPIPQTVNPFIAAVGLATQHAAESTVAFHSLLKVLGGEELFGNKEDVQAAAGYFALGVFTINMGLSLYNNPSIVKGMEGLQYVK